MPAPSIAPTVKMATYRTECLLVFLHGINAVVVWNVTDQRLDRKVDRSARRPSLDADSIVHEGLRREQAMGILDTTVDMLMKDKE